MAKRKQYDYTEHFTIDELKRQYHYTDEEALAVQRQRERERSEAIDRETERSERHERYLREKDIKNHVASVPDLSVYHVEGRDEVQEANNRLVFWEVLRELDEETALIVVLRYGMGYSATEVSAGLGKGYARVKYLCDKARRK